MNKKLSLAQADACREMDRQKGKWGFPQPAMQNLALAMTVLGEEYGEACKAVVELSAGPPSGDSPIVYQGTPHNKYWILEIRKELIQTAAVAMSIVEHIDTDSIEDVK